ncbi:NADPH-dependent aldehyde reductase ARI1 [Acropora cervicornis]|uniref:NADPH-dependent aldehyde reductase ARI1 n=1 Tax=Acropora cervicornis TaxID=6130 RepID=A0AAD9R6G5_ACRCE|nr:NADPH-dependent aldehyde reductase ARI1 [Acropora cervicornis]
MSRVLVTGASGYLAMHVVKQLVDTGELVDYMKRRFLLSMTGQMRNAASLMKGANYVLRRQLGSWSRICQFHRRFLQHEMPAVPKMCLGCCDVRDVAEAHITAMKSPKAPGNRYITISGSLWLQDIAKILDEEFRPLGYNVPTWAFPSFGLKIVSWFDASVRAMIPFLDHELKLDNSKIKADLGYQPTDLKKSIIDMAYNLIDSGFIKKTPQYEEAMKKKAES